jgi:membrane protein YdbS with pleckstrin-like domain
MGDLDRAKDSINNTRLYMSFVITLLIAIGAGISSLYASGRLNALFWIGGALLFLLITVFIFLAKRLHKKTDNLKDL